MHVVECDHCGGRIYPESAKAPEGVYYTVDYQRCKSGAAYSNTTHLHFCRECFAEFRQGFVMGGGAWRESFDS